MTAFLQGWLDHWWLLPVLVLFAPVAYYGWLFLYNDINAWRKRRREP